eukprot:COSAG01_NODE_4714_length_4796_cov_6.907813_4_plen_199_part_00
MLKAGADQVRGWRDAITNHHAQLLLLAPLVDWPTIFRRRCRSGGAWFIVPPSCQVGSPPSSWWPPSEPDQIVRAFSSSLGAHLAAIVPFPLEFCSSELVVVSALRKQRLDRRPSPPATCSRIPPPLSGFSIYRPPPSAQGCRARRPEGLQSRVSNTRLAAIGSNLLLERKHFLFLTAPTRFSARSARQSVLQLEAPSF